MHIGKSHVSSRWNAVPRWFCFLLVAGAIPGCASLDPTAEVIATSNPQFASHRVLRLVIAAPHFQPQNAKHLEDRLCATLVASVERCTGASELFNSDKAPTFMEILAALEERGDDTVLFLQRTSDESHVQYLGSVLWRDQGAADGVRNPNLYAEEINPITLEQRAAAGIASLVDVATRTSVWSAHIHATGTDEGGSDVALINAAVDSLVSELMQTPYFR